MEECIAIFSAWNKESGDLVKAADWPLLSNEIRTLARARWQEKPHEIYWDQVVGKVRKSDFCNGSGKQGWRASIGWLLKPGNAARVFQGEFDNEKARSSKNKKPTQKKELDYDCSWCGQSGYVFTRNIASGYNVGFRCQCEIATRLDPEVPIFFPQDFLDEYRPDFYYMLADNAGPEKLMHPKTAEINLEENKKRLGDIIKMINSNPVRGVKRGSDINYAFIEENPSDKNDPNMFAELLENINAMKKQHEIQK